MSSIIKENTFIEPLRLPEHHNENTEIENVLFNYNRIQAKLEN